MTKAELERRKRILIQKNEKQQSGLRDRRERIQKLSSLSPAESMTFTGDVNR